MLPPTRARSGGRGLSLSLFSCLLDCRRPPGGAARHDPSAGPGVLTQPTQQLTPGQQAPQDPLRRMDACPDAPGAPHADHQLPDTPPGPGPALRLTLPFRPFFKVLVLVLGSNGIFGLVV